MVEEFAVLDGELKLIKKKVTKRDIPPDIKAVKLIMEGENIQGLSDEELIREREQILKLLKENNIE